MFKVEKIQHKDGQYIPGTESELYTGADKSEAEKAFDAFEETDTETAIISEYAETEDRWEIIKEK